MNQAAEINWNWYQFNQLSNRQLYDLLALRQEVFIVEQQCIYPDIDGLDPDCLHLIGVHEEKIIAYLRLIPSAYHESGNIALGRIISIACNRGAGIGKAMMQQAMSYISEHFPNQNVQLAAQFHLHDFYQKFGFESISEPYDEDGILHLDMLYQQKSVS